MTDTTHHVGDDREPDRTRHRADAQGNCPACAGPEGRTRAEWAATDAPCVRSDSGLLCEAHERALFPSLARRCNGLRPDTDARVAATERLLADTVAEARRELDERDARVLAYRDRVLALLPTYINHDGDRHRLMEGILDLAATEPKEAT